MLGTDAYETKNMIRTILTALFSALLFGVFTPLAYFLMLGNFPLAGPRGFLVLVGVGAFVGAILGSLFSRFFGFLFECLLELTGIY